MNGQRVQLSSLVLASIALGWLHIPPMFAQEASLPLLRANSRLTPVDVTVVDSKGRPIQGLKASDFHVFDDGKEQPIRNFEEYAATTVRPTHPPPKLPPNIYTNLQPAPASSSVNVLLLDALNTKLTDQAFVRSEALSYLKTMPPGTRIAIMTLSNQLHLLQGFSANPEMLSAALKSKNNHALPSPLLDQDLADGNATSEDLIGAGAAAGMQAFANDVSNFQGEVRNQMTLEALDQIAGYLATIPGRKNLIWFASGMPLQIFPSEGGNIATLTDYTREVRKTADLLAAAQIAVYPIDAQGLHGNMEGSATKSGSAGRDTAAQNLAFLTRTASEQLSMTAIAEATGGVAYFNTNGLGEAVGKAIENGANFYMISYTPPQSVYDGAYHKITVKTDRPGVHLSYRTGYYADDVAHNSFAASYTPPATPADGDDNHMAASMQRGAPASSQILFDVGIQPLAAGLNPAGTPVLGKLNSKLENKSLKRYDFRYIFPGRQLQLTQSSDHVYHGSLDFEIAAYDVNGTLLNGLSQTIELPLSADKYATLQHAPFQFSQQIDLPPGDIFVHIGIRDRVSGRIGTLELPLSVSRKDGPSTVSPTNSNQ